MQITELFAVTYSEYAIESKYAYTQFNITIKYLTNSVKTKMYLIYCPGGNEYCSPDTAGTET